MMYERIARYYDLLHEQLIEDIGFSLELAGLPAGNILELGCGTGRLAIPLARAGHTVFGMDNSKSMLEIARNRRAVEPPEVQSRLHWLQADMCDQPSIASAFSLIFSGHNTIMHLPPIDLQIALRAARRSLTSGGRLLLDLANPFVIMQTQNDGALTLENVLCDPETGDTVLMMARNWLDVDAQLLRVTWILDISPPDGLGVRRDVFTSDYHFLYPHQIELSLQKAGLALRAMYGDYDRAPFAESSHRMIIMAERHGN